jgi:hypothetical protein
MARARAASLWVVNRCAPMASAWSEQPEFFVSETEALSCRPLEGFADKKAAEAVRDGLERKARETAPIGPLLRFLLPNARGAIAVAAKAANLPPPDYDALGPEVHPLREGSSITHTAAYTAYRDRLEETVAAWWAGVSADLSPEANAVLWDALFPDFRFYSVSRVLFE